MTEEEANKALFAIHYEYMTHTPKDRLKLYDEYQKKRNQIKESLANTVHSSLSINDEIQKGKS